jgi:hypothetical protein
MTNGKGLRLMRTPDFKADGWCLEDGEEHNREAPDTFLIPDLEVREILQPGDFAKLIFRIAVEDESEPEAVERMWVIVRERVGNGYLGMLDNNPSSIAENEVFWRGTELPFEPKHIISVKHGNAKSFALAEAPVPRSWK